MAGRFVLDLAYGHYHRRTNQHPDNQRMSRLRREPGECGVERLNSRDQYGDYYVEHCYFDANGNWHCTHYYHDHPQAKASHIIYKNGGHYFENPDGTQAYYHPQQPNWARWKRTDKYAPKIAWDKPQSECVASVNPPPRWWMEQNQITPFPGQNELADKIDRFLEKAAKSPNTPAPFTRQSGGRANGIFEGLDFLLPDDDIARVECESKDSLPDGGCNPDAQPQESSEKDDNKSKNESTDAGPKKAERADGLNDPNGRGVIQNSESAAASSAAAPLNSSSVRSSLATCQTSQKNEKQAAVPKNKSVKVTAPRQQTVPPAWSMTARLRQTNPKQESSYYYEDDKGWMLLSRLAPGRKRKAETMTKSQPKKPRMASKKQARV